MTDITPDSIDIRGVRYVPETAQIPVGDKKILVLQRGWVVIGNVTENKESGQVEIRNGSVIRIWGTTKGLGELVNGPTKDTKLDPVPSLIEVHPLTIISRISVNASKW